MPQRAIFTEEQPQFRYFLLNNGKADVFIYKFISKEKDEEGNDIYIYEINEFRCAVDEITEEMVSNNPLKYINYNPNNTVVSIEERVTAIEDAILELAGGVDNG